MTLRELNNLQYINAEIKTLEERIAEIRTRAEHITPNVQTYKNEAGEVCVLQGVVTCGEWEVVMGRVYGVGEALW